MRVQPASEFKTAYDAGLARFKQEAEHLVDIKHPNIVRCMDYMEANGTAYLVMEYEDGLALSQLLADHEGRGQPYCRTLLVFCHETKKPPRDMGADSAR